MGGDPRRRPSALRRGQAPLLTPDDPILARIRAIPPGFVAAYGDVSPRAPRAAGAALARASDPRLPWWRVVRGDGSLAKGERQRVRLEEEGVPFRDDRVDMRVARWTG